MYGLPVVELRSPLHRSEPSTQSRRLRSRRGLFRNCANASTDSSDGSSGIDAVSFHASTSRPRKRTGGLTSRHWSGTVFRFVKRSAQPQFWLPCRLSAPRDGGQRQWCTWGWTLGNTHSRLFTSIVRSSMPRPALRIRLTEHIASLRGECAERGSTLPQFGHRPATPESQNLHTNAL